MKYQTEFLALTVAVAGIGATALSGSSASAQTPTPPVATTTATRATRKIDPAALAILKKSNAATRALKTYQADWWRTITVDGETRYSLERSVAAKPNKLRFDSWDTPSSAQTATAAEQLKKTNPMLTLVNDGKTRFLQRRNTYSATPATGPTPLGSESLVGFFNEQGWIQDQIDRAAQNGKESIELRKLPAETQNGVLCDKVLFVTSTADKSAPRQFESRSTYYFGRADGLLRRVDQEASSVSADDTARMKGSVVARKIITNAPVTSLKTVFAYVPPKGVTKEKPVTPEDTALLANGTVAPDFTATDKDGKQVKLSDFKGKVVVLDFWASWCPPCVASMPHNQAVTKKLQGENLPVVLLAVDNSEEQPAFAKWVDAHKELDALTFVYADPKVAKISRDLYKVTGIPTQYIIDANGVIRASSVGFGGEDDTLEKSVRAALDQQ